MVMSVTPMVCMTLAFWLGRIGLTCSGGCCADAYGTAQMSANRIAKVKSESRLREIMVALLVVEIWAHYVSRRGTSARSVCVVCGRIYNFLQIRLRIRRQLRRSVMFIATRV